MKRIFLKLLVVISIALSANILAAIDTYEFADEQTRQRFYQLNDELRCPKCQNQALGDSNSPIAMDLRREVYRLLNEGKSDQQIKDYLVARYGEYILYRPELSSHTLMLWLTPLILLLIGLAVVLLMIKRRKTQTAAPTLDVAEQQRLDTLIQQDVREKSEPKPTSNKNGELK